MDTRSITDFAADLARVIGAGADPVRSDNIEAARKLVSELNAYLYQTGDELGSASFGDEQLQYLSEFHKYWEREHEALLDPSIVDGKVETAARALSSAVRKYGSGLLETPDTSEGLPRPDVAQVRFFTANQDFRRPPLEQYKQFMLDPRQFDATEIAARPEEFLRCIGVSELSQSDKRIQFARNAAKFLLDRHIRAYDLAAECGHNAAAIRDLLIDTPNIGYGLKKANMFLRDMVALDVWQGLDGLWSIDVPSDVNTMKLALRSGILRTAIPLVSSFLDIFCHQVSCVDRFAASAWRSVWVQWCKLDGETAPPSPCMMDSLLYRIGREHCGHILGRYVCENKHSFHYFYGRLRKCIVCAAPATMEERLLPCQVDHSQLPRRDGLLLFDSKKLLRCFDGQCILEPACDPRSDAFIAYDAPKSISVKGQTGWTTAYASAAGGGGLMA